MAKLIDLIVSGKSSFANDINAKIIYSIRLYMSGAISTCNTGGRWVSGMTNAAIRYNNNIALTTSDYHPFLSMKANSGHVVNFGGIKDTIGFYGYHNGRTENGYDWKFVVDSSTGEWSMSSSITSSKFITSGGNDTQVVRGDGTLALLSTLSVGNADKLDGVHASGLFTALTNSGNNISVTVGGTNKKLTVGYASNADTVDGYHASHFATSGHTHTFDSLTSKPTTIAGYGITDALTKKRVFSKVDYQFYVILLCKIGNSATNTYHTINGTFWSQESGITRYQAANVNIHCSDWNGGHNNYYNFSPFGLGTKCRLITCTYNSNQYLAVTFENIQKTTVYFDGSYANIDFTPVLYYTQNTSTVNNSEIYNSISEVSYNQFPLIPSSKTVLHSGNYNSYSPTLTGTGASGTWGISISGSANSLNNLGTLDTQEKIDNFLTGNKFQYATFKTSAANNVGFGSNDGMILSIPFTNSTYGAQLAFDDVPSAALVKVRCKSTNWGSWYTLLHSGNYSSTLDGRYYTETEVNNLLAKYLLLSGGTMSGSITFTNRSSNVYTTSTTSEWIYISRLYTGSTASSAKYHAGIGWHNTGGSGNGALTLVPFAQDTEPWSSSVGLYISQNSLKFNGTNVSLNGHTHDSRYLRKDTNDSTEYQYSFTKTDGHAIQVGTIRGRGVGSLTGEIIHIYDRVHIGSPEGWGSRDAPSNGLSTYGGAWLATDKGNVGIGTTSPTEKLHVKGSANITGPAWLNDSIYIIDCPSNSTLQSSYGLPSNYTTEDFLKAWTKFARGKVAGRTVIGYIRPNSRGMIQADVYSTGINSSSGLPEHITGRYYPHGGSEIIFGTSYGKWYYRTGIDSGNISSQSVSYASNAGNADTLDNYHASGLFTALSNSGNDISITVGGTTKTLTVGYATSSINANKIYINNSSSNSAYPVLFTNITSAGTPRYDSVYVDSASGAGYNPNTNAFVASIMTAGTHNSTSTLYLSSGNSTSSIIFKIGGVEKARLLQPNGYLGIGTTNPAYPLSVTGTIHATTGFNANGKAVIDDTGRFIPANASCRNAGAYGVYDPYKVGHVWSMGSSFSISADGSSTGNLYGLAYFHTNWSNSADYNKDGKTEVSTYAGGHQIAMIVKGQVKASLGSNIWSRGGFIKNGSSNDYALMGGGGHKNISNVQNTAFYKRIVTVNGSGYDMAGTTSSAAFTIYAPTAAGTSGQVLKSTGGTPTWINQSDIIAGSAISTDILNIKNINSETDIVQSGIRGYSGSGSNWTGSINSMKYAAIFSFGNPNRGWQLWAERAGEARNGLCWRRGIQAATSWDSERLILDSDNYTSYVNTTNFPGLNKTGTVTSVTVTGSNGLSGSGTITTSGTITLSNSGVRSVTINGNYLRVNTNGKNTDLTIPYATNADKLDGVHASGLFTNLSNSGNNISITVGGTNKTLTVGYASNADTVDGYHHSDFVHTRSAIAGTDLNVYDINNSFIHDYIWTNAPTSNIIGSVIDLTYSPDWRYQIFCVPNSNNLIYTRARYSGTTWTNWKTIAFTDSDITGNAATATDADKLDGVHASGLFTNLSNSGNNISVTIGGSNKTLTVGYATSAGSATSATKLKTARTIWGKSFNGTENVSGDLSGVTNINASGNIYAAAFYENSDVRLKKDVSSIVSSVNIPVIKEFKWKQTNHKSYGLIAQDLEAMGYPELVYIKDDGYKSVNYTAAHSLIIGKLQLKIKELEDNIADLLLTQQVLMKALGIQ